jgi:extradiol dioxygenase family protein
MLLPFHFAFKVKDINSTISFYHDILGCTKGRSTDSWVDFNFFGHQLSAHVSEDIPALDYCGKVDEISVPIPHFGCLLPIELFKSIQDKFEKNNVSFIVRPTLRYEGKTGEQMTLFVLDYSNNPIEFKSYSDNQEMFI